MKQRMARLPESSYRIALLAVLFGIIVAFGVFSFAPSASAAPSVSPALPKSAVITIRTHLARSVRVIESSPTPKQKCYNTPNHAITVTGWEGRVEFIGYSSTNCLGRVLCVAVVTIPPSGFLIITLC
jgi:hypothetical protein